MASFLFWNLAGNSPVEVLADLVHQHDLDVLVLAEWAGLDSTTLLSELGAPFNLLPLHGCQKLLILSRIDPACWTPVRDTQDMTLRSLQIPGAPEILLAAVHLPSRLRNNSRATQAALCEDIANTIVAAEQERHHARTILVGDLNQDPHDPGLIHAAALNAVMSRAVAQQQTRTLRGGRSYRLFFNPMWHLYGDALSSPPGSYYYRTNETDCLFWHLFDQVLVRPDLLDSFDANALCIVSQYQTRAGQSVSLLSAGGIPRRAISDHLPLIFRLRMGTTNTDDAMQQLDAV